MDFRLKDDASDGGNDAIPSRQIEMSIKCCCMMFSINYKSIK